MEEIALPRRSSTLAPPPLETAACGTRALQRFDLGSARRDRAAAQVAELWEHSDASSDENEIKIVVATVRMAVLACVKNLPPVEELVPRSITIPMPPPPPRVIFDAYAEPVALLPPAPLRGLDVLRQSAWAFAASASLLGMGSIATAVVYVFFFP